MSRSVERTTKGAAGCAARVAAAFLALQGCAGDRPAEAPTELPSLPVRTLVEDLRIGSLDGPDALSQVASVDVDASGDIYVLQPREQSVRVFGADGAFRGTLGGPGEGPGEFLRPTLAGIHRDTLWVAEPGRRRLAFLSLDGRPLRQVAFSVQVPFEPPPGRPPGGPPMTMSVGPRFPLADGALLTVVERPRIVAPGMAPGKTEQGTVYLRVSPAGEVLDTLFDPGVVAAGTVFLPRADEPDELAAVMPQPFSDAPLVAYDPGGGRFLTIVDRGRDDGLIGVTRIDVEGDTLWTSEVPHRRVPLTEARIDSLLVAGVPRGLLGSDGAYRSAEEYLPVMKEEMYRPAHLPPVDGALVGRDGSVVLRVAGAEGPGRRYLVLAADGTPLESWQGPEEAELKAVSPPFAYGVVIGELDVPYVVRYRISG